MTYESQWKSVIDKEWENYKTSWEEENPGKELDQTRFTFMGSFMKQKYLEETEEVVDDVRNRREELIKEDEEGGEQKNVDYQEYLDFIIPLGMMTHHTVVRSIVCHARLPWWEIPSTNKLVGT